MREKLGWIYGGCFLTLNIPSTIPTSLRGWGDVGVLGWGGGGCVSEVRASERGWVSPPEADRSLMTKARLVLLQSLA